MMVPYINIHAHRKSVRPDREWVLTSMMAEDFPLQGLNKGNYSVGVHPWHVKKVDINKELERLAKNVRDERVLAVGEIGLDKAKDEDVGLQLDVLEKQVCIAEEAGIPIIFHIVKASNEIFEFVKVHAPKVPLIVHGYLGSVELAEQFVKRGFYLSFGESIFYSQKNCSVLSKMPLESLFFETDESVDSIEMIYMEAARLLGLNVQELKEQMWKNAKKVFGDLSV